MVAIKIRDLNRHFATPLGMDSTDSAVALRALRRLFGLDAGKPSISGIESDVILSGMALQDINLDIEEGSAVCLVGASGSGKSVLLKVLAGAIAPSQGRIELSGTVNSLLGLNEDIDVRLTALENIENFRRMKRLPLEGWDRRVREIIAFAELERFENMPVRSYSTGMGMRLSISLALNASADIILIDDVLGVGDIAFQQKCVQRLSELREEGRTLVLVLSDDALVRQIATRVITLSSGHVAADGSPMQLLSTQKDDTPSEVTWHVSSYLPENDVIVFRSADLVTLDIDGRPHLRVTMRFVTKVADLNCRPLVILTVGRVVFLRSVFAQERVIETPGELTYTLDLPTDILGAGTYNLTPSMVSIWDKRIFSMKAHNLVSIEVKRPLAMTEGDLSSPLSALVLPWDIETLESGARV
jgi:ABC-type polysaccharide/polyol phosphate transport system ATPase subunit